MNDLQRQRLRASAHRVIAYDLLADGHLNWAMFHQEKVRDAEQRARDIWTRQGVDNPYGMAI